jgi:beta-glucosidase
MASALGDRVALWSTLNEPWCSAFLGYGSGEHAPGRTDAESALMAAHHLLLGHGLATQALRANLPNGSPVSIVLNLGAVRPASLSALDRDAVRRIDALQNRLFLDALFRGQYPDDLLADTVCVSDWSFVRAADLSVISTGIDVLGLNYYGPSVVGSSSAVVGDRPEAPSAWPGSTDVVFSNPGFPVTDMGWPVDADGLIEILTRVQSDYGDIAMMVTENGAAYPDVVDSDGNFHDHERVNYLREHIAAAATAIKTGVDLRGYFIWSLLDNFEWAWGYGKRFGIVHVDYATQRRTWKDSATWYQRFLATGELT